jgi:hypothetical protein
MMLACAMLQAQGIVVVQQQTSNGQTSTSQIQLDKTHIRAESRASGESMAFLFDEAAQTARVLNLDKKTYMEMNAAMSRQVQQQLAQVQAQLQNLPPEQRAALEQALRARGGLPGGFAARGAKLEYRRSGSDKVGKWACTKYEGYQAQQKVIELCTIDPKELGLTIADFEVATHLVEFLQGFLPQAAGQIVVAGTASEQGFSGIPVRRTTFTDGRVDTVTETKEIRREAIPAAAFEVPAGFKREDPMR